MPHTWISRSEDETRELGHRLGRRLRGGEVVLLCGDLGVGKTQFAQGIGRALAIPTPLVSPTFTLAVHYEGRLPLVHYDLYRIESTAELDEIGFLELDDARTVAVVEWADRTDMPVESIRVDFQMHEDGGRRIRITGMDLDAADQDAPERPSKNGTS